jgi:putative acetyltransferase
MIEFILVTTEEEYQAAAALFNEYAVWLNIDLSFQDFAGELATLKSMYALPKGGIIVLKDEHIFGGCVAIRKLDDETAELKRMYLQPAYRQRGLGMILLQKALTLAKEYGYTAVRLDTLNTMAPAMGLYKKAGFTETPAYYFNPNDSAVYFYKIL